MRTLDKLLYAFALWATMVTPCAGAEQKLVTVVVGDIVAADNNENRTVKSLGATAIRTALTQWEIQNPDLKLSVRLERDRQIEVDKLIEDEQRRSAILKPEAIKKLRNSSVKYFIFVQYTVIDSNRIRLSASLAKLDDNRSLVVRSEEDTLDTGEPEFISLVSIGVKIYQALLAEEQLPFKPRTFPLVACAKDRSFVASLLLSLIRSDLNRRKPWNVRELTDGNCAELARPAVGGNTLTLTLEIEKEGELTLVRVQVKYENTIVAEHSTTVTVKTEEFMKNSDEVTKVIGIISRRLRTDCEQWRPPS